MDNRATQDALGALRRVHDAMGEATGEVRASVDVDWVSAAAHVYRELLGDVLHDATRLTAELGEAWGPVLRHAAAADEARTASMIARPVAVAR
ncbi:MAG: hypothetical protein HGA44_06680 [Cellulomonadaceae bacterium]|nr:hypothetical protein [Cellulomonadaceae bacterium]